MTILEALNWAQEQLKQTLHEKNDAQTNPMVDAQILLADLLQKPTSYLFAHFETSLSPDVRDAFQRAIQRRKRHEPVAHLLGVKHFYGRPFYVNPAVLIPRPATEQLVELAKANATPESTIIDIGTGSGAIAVTLAKELNQPVIAIDIDPQALTVAKHNAATHSVEKQISFLHGSLLSPFLQRNIRETQQGQTVITANLPYLTPAQWRATDPDVRHYEPKHALVGGIDGLDFYDTLLQQLSQERSRFGNTLHVFFEIDPTQEQPLTVLIQEHFPSADITFYQDLQQNARIAHITI